MKLANPKHHARLINISISDNMFDRLRELKNELTGKRKVSRVCQRALAEYIKDLESIKEERDNDTI